MSIQFTLKQLINSGIHLGTVVSNTTIPTSYLFAQSNGYSIFDVSQTYYLLRRLIAFTTNLSFRKGIVLFVTITPSRSLQRLTYITARKSFQYSYVNSRWEGGILSNWKEISIKRFKKFTANKLVHKKYIGKVEKRNLDKLLFFYNSFTSVPALKMFKKEIGIPRFPDAVFLINPYNIKEPVLEVSKVGMPLLGIVDSDNAYSEKYTFAVPANDDSFLNLRTFLNIAGISMLKGINHTRSILWSSKTNVRSKSKKIYKKK